MKKLKYFIPSILLMIFIFIMSQTPADESSMQSGFIQTLLYDILHIYLPMFIIRKGAHMSEYALLCLSFYYGLSHTSINKLYNPVLFSFIYACTDEFHQLFIAGRSGQFSDVMIDTLAAVIMMVVVVIIKTILNKRKGSIV